MPPGTERLRRLSRFNYRLEKIAKSGGKREKVLGVDEGKYLRDETRWAEGAKGLVEFSGSGSKRDNSKIRVQTSQKASSKGTHRRNCDEQKEHTSAWERQTDGRKDNKLRLHNAGHYCAVIERTNSKRDSERESERDRKGRTALQKCCQRIA